MRCTQPNRQTENERRKKQNGREKYFRYFCHRTRNDMKQRGKCTVRMRATLRNIFFSHKKLSSRYQKHVRRLQRVSTTKKKWPVTPPLTPLLTRRKKWMLLSQTRHEFRSSRFEAQSATERYRWTLMRSALNFPRACSDRSPTPRTSCGMMVAAANGKDE